MAGVTEGSAGKREQRITKSRRILTTMKKKKRNLVELEEIVATEIGIVAVVGVTEESVRKKKATRIMRTKSASKVSRVASETVTVAVAGVEDEFAGKLMPRVEEPTKKLAMVEVTRKLTTTQIFKLAPMKTNHVLVTEIVVVAVVAGEPASGTATT